MENKDLSDKKINNEQKVNEGFSGENIPDDYNPARGKLQSETEIDKKGAIKTVERARNTDSNPTENQPNSSNNQGGADSEELAKKTVENKDRNSDITPNRYTSSHPDNHKNRGNIELDNN